MKMLLVAVALLVTIQVHPGWSTYPGFQNGRGNNPGLSWAHPQWTQNQNNGFSSDVQWVCQNPKTNDIMIIATDDTRHMQHNPNNKGPWWQWHNVPPGHQREHHQQGNYWTQPIIIIQETPNSEGNQTPRPFPTTEIPIPKPTSPPYHGGEGSIDIRAGAK